MHQKPAAGTTVKADEQDVTPFQGLLARFEPIIANLLAATAYLRQRGFVYYGVPKVWRALQLLVSLSAHRNVVRVLAHPQSARLVRQYPVLAFKYFGNYVARQLPLRTRRSIFLHHYRFLQKNFTTTFLDSVLTAAPILWRQSVEDESFEIVVESMLLGSEGELRLLFRMTSREVYRLIFVFAAGRDFNLPDETIIIVVGIKGVPDFDLVKLATKTCHDILPAHILMAALEGVAEAAGISTMLGPHETRQVFCGDKLFFSYGAFFETYGREIPGKRMYRICVPHARKPSCEVKATHRRRNRRKRQFRDGVNRRVLEAVRVYLHENDGAPGRS